MRLVITGASGFLGRYVVAEALRRGHRVRAIVTPTSDETGLPWRTHSEVELVRLDLQRKRGIRDALQNVDAVLHLAARKHGDFHEQFSSTVGATSNLLEAMLDADVLRLVAISSLSVLDYLHARRGETIDEDSTLETDPTRRDAYARTKLLQEGVIRDFQRHPGAQVTVLRPGVLYGRGNLWNARLGVQLGANLWLRIGNDARIPLSYVENCAEAIVIAAEAEEAINQTLHIVDDDLPTQRTYAAELATRIRPAPHTIPIGYSSMCFIARAVSTCNSRLLRNRIGLPGLLVPARMHARFKPLHYSNQRAKQILNWTPRYPLTVALERSCLDPNSPAALGQNDRRPHFGRR